MVDKTAPCGKPAAVTLGEENASFRWIVKVRPSRNALRIESTYIKLKYTHIILSYIVLIHCIPILRYCGTF